MNIEKERKFLVNADKLPTDFPITGRQIIAGYFTREGEPAVRVTKRSDGVTKFCIKSVGGEVREEFEYRLIKEDAERLLTISPTEIVKIRYDYQGWEVDCFGDLPRHFIGCGHDKVLWMAEYEEVPGKPPIPVIPPWIFREVTGEPRWSNQALAWEYGNKRRKTST